VGAKTVNVSNISVLLSDICPVCYRFGYAEVQKRCWRSGGSEVCREYIYFVHEERVDGRRRRYRCYIGPVDEYLYVEGKHGLGLTNIITQDYVGTAYAAAVKHIELVLKSLDSIVAAGRPRSEAAKFIASELDRLIAVLRKAIDEAEKAKQRVLEST
jgi:hypothetical protein